MSAPPRPLVLITGMSGLIGGLAGRALMKTHRVRALNRRDVPGFETVRADITDFDAIRPAFDGVHTVVHLSALLIDVPDRELLRVNIEGTYNVFEAARQAGVKRVVFASSGAVMGGYMREEPFKSLLDWTHPGLPEVTRRLKAANSPLPARERAGESVQTSRLQMGDPSSPLTERETGARRWRARVRVEVPELSRGPSTGAGRAESPLPPGDQAPATAGAGEGQVSPLPAGEGEGEGHNIAVLDTSRPWRLISHLDPARPTVFYAVTKIAGEATGQFFHATHGLSVICIRFGAVFPDDRPARPSAAAVYMSQRDATQVVTKSVTAPEGVGFEVFYALSDNAARFRDIDHARKVTGFVPQDGILEWPLPPVSASTVPGTKEAP